MLNPAGSKEVRRIIETETRRVLSCDLVIQDKPRPPLPQAMRIRGLVMHLVNRDHLRACVHDGSAQTPGLVNKPGVPGAPTNGQIGYVGPKITREKKEVAIPR